MQHENGRSEQLVVRKSNPTVAAPFLELPHEFTLLHCLQAAGFPCPRPIDLAVSPGGLDDTFYTMERLPGRIPGSYFEHVTLQTEVLLRLADVLAKLHNTPLESYRDFIKDCGVESVLNETVEQCYHRKMKELREYTGKVEHLPSPYVTWLFRWLENNIPKCTNSPVLCHGDFNFHNVLIGDDDSVTGVLDWECAEFGAPEQDLAYFQSHVSRHMEWDDFVEHYNKCGGRMIDLDWMKFCARYNTLRILLALIRKILDLQLGLSDDIRYLMIQLVFAPRVMELGMNDIRKVVVK
ncbi:uncharacterized protein A1O5_11621 [Cladophialophora psammophila CBS 110553]|uniref:Aminoglycoside phosphotransferase domain-containing protein n=1 Tax=Cladophialophora psammophila CBS 110553 TaxID=1182543 RepID=W9WE65_9EURO|nr:uncharacterized protein A1O5_11621 [Cladophialophora psammophila CBS 110553]EXJ63300.1 hypothetical protein A1O5_11621 [Cladophialophora psammophila CBS 110553]